jgi:uncharacterized protein (TIGR03435 family)
MNAWVEVAGWTLIHFVWQGALIGLGTAAALRLLRDRSPHARYALACTGLTLMLASPIVTAGVLRGAGTYAMPYAVDVHRPDAATAARRDGRTTAAPSPVPAAFALPALPGVNRTIDVETLLQAVVGIWLLGVLLLFLRMAGGYRRVRHLYAVSLLNDPSRWSRSARRISARLGLSRIVRVVDSDIVDTPTVIGWMRPVVLLPVAALATLTPSQVEAILAHELAHIRRHDFLANTLQTLTETLLFYHPAVWWVSRRIRAERENCCDDIAVDVCGDPYAYAAALTEIAALSIATRPLTVTATGGSLLHRVRRLLGVKPAAHRRSTSSLVALGIAVALVLGGGTLRLYSMVQNAPAVDDTDHRGFGPPDVARLLGFPGRSQYPADNPHGATSWGARIQYPGGEMALIGFTPRELIRDAYDLIEVPIAGAPDWLDRETFDITIPADAAVAVDGVSDPGLVRAALRRYFETELSLSWHFETREFPVYALVRTDANRLGPNIRPTADICLDGEKLRARRPAGGNRQGQTARFCGVEQDLFGITAEKVTMHEFAREMKRRLTPVSVEREVVDRTGLGGAFDFELRVGLLPLAVIARRWPAAGTLFYPAGVRSVFTALPEQLGLKLEESTDARQVLVIDHIDRPAPTQ